MKFIAAGALVLAAVLVLAGKDDIRRFLRIRSM